MIVGVDRSILVGNKPMDIVFKSIDRTVRANNFGETFTAGGDSPGRIRYCMRRRLSLSGRQSVLVGVRQTSTENRYL